MLKQSTLCAAVLSSLLFLACSLAPEPAGPAVDTPEWFWQGALDSYRAGDFEESLEYLDKLIDKDDPLAQDAVVLRAVLLAGLAGGRLELADAAREAIRKRPGLASEWQGVLGSESGRGRQAAFTLVESLDRLDETLAAGSVEIRFPFPPGGPGRSPVVHALEAGNPPAKAQLEGAVAHTLRRHVVLIVSRLVGAGESAADARAVFEAPPVTLTAARAHYEFASVMGELAVRLRQNLLNDPKLRPILLDSAEQWAGRAVAGDDAAIAAQARELRAKIRNERRAP